jgi:hypothetical protein
LLEVEGHPPSLREMGLRLFPCSRPMFFLFKRKEYRKTTEVFFEDIVAENEKYILKLTDGGMQTRKATGLAKQSRYATFGFYSQWGLLPALKGGEVYS